MTHTPGPWTSGGFAIVSDRPYPQWREIATVACDPRDLSDPEAAANARLIAAAPELLSALREIVHYDEGSSEQGSYGYDVLGRCKAAIAKAEGRDA
jgi:hypothetical protein